MKKFILFIFLFPLLAFGQKELHGQWNLQFLTWNDSIVFDIQNENTGTQESSVSVSFETENDSLNEELSENGAYEAWKGIYLSFGKKGKLQHNNLTIANGIYINELYNGEYIYDQAAQTIHLITHTENGKTNMDAVYSIEINGDEIHLTIPDKPGYNAIYKLQK